MNRFDFGSFYEIQEIGKGGEGTVFRATIRSFGRVAVKVYHSSSSVNHRELKNIYQYSHHPNIVRLLGFIENANLDGDHFSRRTGYVMEYMVNGSVHDAIHRRKIEYSLDTAYSWICQTARALLYLHENHLIHRDLKPRNLLLCDDLMNVKICDFGLTRDCKEESTLTAGIGSLRYMAPEMIRAGSGNKYDKSVDVYSLGITIWEILTKRIPYDHVPHLLTSEFTLCEAVVKGVRPETPADLQWDVQFIIENSWMINTIERIQIEDIHNFFEAKLHKDHSDDMQGESSEQDDSESEKTITETATVPSDPSMGPENPIDYVTWLAVLLKQSTKSGTTPKMPGKDGTTVTGAIFQVAAGDHPKNQRLVHNSSAVTPAVPDTVTSSHSDLTVVHSQVTRKEELKEGQNTEGLTAKTEEFPIKSSSISDRIRQLQIKSKESKNPKEKKAWEVKVSPNTTCTLNLLGNDRGIEYPPNTLYWEPGIPSSRQVLKTVAIEAADVDLGFEFQKIIDKTNVMWLTTLCVTKVNSKSPAQKAGLLEGDGIYRVNAKHIDMMDDDETREFLEVIKHWTYKHPLVLAVKRNRVNSRPNRNL